MKVVMMPHGARADGASHSLPLLTVANPPMTLFGMDNVSLLIPRIEELGRFDHCFSSRSARGLDAASVFALALDVDISSLKELTIYANRKDDGTVVFYPGHETENNVYWQKQGLEAMRIMFEGYGGEPDSKLLALSHRPIIAGIVGHSRGIVGNEDELAALALDKGGTLFGQNYIVIETEDGKTFTVHVPIPRASDPTY